MRHLEKIVILDFGGQYAHLIASRIRRMQIFTEIWPADSPVQKFKDSNIKGLILSGGPQSVFDPDSPKGDGEIFSLGLPILGICFGHQFLCQHFGARVRRGQKKEYGGADLFLEKSCPIFDGLDRQKTRVWMSHSDEVESVPAGFRAAASTENCENAAVFWAEKNIFSLQFHPEVTHSEGGQKILENFAQKICRARADWTAEKFLDSIESEMRQKIGDKNVFLLVSGGVDSTVAFGFLSKILGEGRVRGLLVDHGLLRQNEAEKVAKSLAEIGANLTVLDEKSAFLEKLQNVVDPEKKREIIGHAFLEVQQAFFEREKIGENWLLGQGTIYPDTIESGGTENAAKIKTHHNRAPEVQKLIDAGKIVEPLADLYKDEVRALGRALGIAENLVARQPFPGPGLGVRILGSEENLIKKVDVAKKRDFLPLPIRSVGVQGDARTFRSPAVILNLDLVKDSGQISLEKAQKLATTYTGSNPQINRLLLPLGQNFSGEINEISVQKSFVSRDRVETLQQADAVVAGFFEDLPETEKAKVWQFPVVLAPVAFNQVGGESVILRPVQSVDAMSASVSDLPLEFFQKTADEILKNSEISAVFLDATSKPPGTIEWE